MPRFTNNNFPTSTSIEETLDQPIFLNPQTKLEFSSDKLVLHPPRNIILFKFPQPGLISSTTTEEKLGFTTANHKRIYKILIYLIVNDLKHLLRTETSQKLLLKTFYHKNEGTRKVKNFQNLSNKENDFKLEQIFHIHFVARLP